jgi:hypothetical protein
VIDQIAFFQRKDHVRESSQHVISVTFRDREAIANVTPTNVYYRIDDLTTGAQVLDWTSVSADDELDITITASQNEMQDQCNTREMRQVVVAANYGLATQYVDSVEYMVENLVGITS